MKKYIVKAEYIDLWGSDYEWTLDPIVTEEDIRSLAASGEESIEELMEQLEEIDDDGDAAAEIVSAGLYAQAVNLMDDDIREELHQDIAPCTDVEFLRAYMERHLAKYGEEFTI